MSSFFFFLCFGALSGLCNGFFGSGGGIPLVFAFAKRGAQKSRYRLALRLTCLFSVLSVLLCWKQTSLSALLFPTLLLAALAGGFVGNLLLRRLAGVWVHRLFALLLICAGGVMLLQRGSM